MFPLLNLGTKPELFFDVNAVDNFLTMLRGVDIMSVPDSIMPEENERTELLEFERALLLITCPFDADTDVATDVVRGLCAGEIDTLALLVLFISLSDFLDAADEERGLPIRPNEKRLVFGSFSG